MENLIFVNDKNIPLVHDEYIDDCNTPNTSRVDETTITTPDTTETISSLQDKVKRKDLQTQVARIKKIH